MRSALFLPIFDALADPIQVARLSAEAEQAGWDGVFVWDHVMYRAPVVEVADPWITLAAIASATERLRLGPMVTPLPRRRPAVVARQTSTLDQLSGGRLTLGVGIGSDDSREMSATGERLEDRVRAQMLDESLEILQAAWSGDPVRHRGEHYLVDDVRFLPRPVQRPGIPVWVAVRYGNARPLRRAIRHDGVFPVNLNHPDQLAELVDTMKQLRADAALDTAVDTAVDTGPSLTDAATFDVAVGGPPGTDPAPYAAVGATWWMVTFNWRSTSIDEVRGVLREGPPAP